MKKDSEHVDDYVLIVDDNIIKARFLEIYLKKKDGLKEKCLIVEKATDGYAALELVERLDNERKILPRIAFIDIDMPRMNGYELIKQLRSMYKNKKRIYICALTNGFASDAEKRLKKACTVGADKAYQKDGFGFINDVVADAYAKLNNRKLQ